MNIAFVPPFVELKVREPIPVKFPAVLRQALRSFSSHSVVSVSHSDLTPHAFPIQCAVEPTESLFLEVHSTFLIRLIHSGTLSKQAMGQIFSADAWISIDFSILATLSRSPRFSLSKIMTI